MSVSRGQTRENRRNNGSNVPALMQRVTQQMRKSRNTPIITIAVIAQLFYACSDRGIREQAQELMIMTRGWADVKIYSEKYAEEVILIGKNPTGYFYKIPHSREVFSYIEIYDRFMFESGRTSNQNSFLDHFTKIDEKKSSLLTFLMAACDNAVYGELLADRYTNLFATYPHLLVRELRKMGDWKRIVDQLEVGNWEAFKEGVNKLRDSKFEKEFKAYVFAPRDEKGNRIMK